MDRGSGTLSKQMADFVIVCIIRQYTRTEYYVILARML